MLAFGFAVNKRLCHTAHEKAFSPVEGTPPHLTRDTSKTSLRKDTSLFAQSAYGAERQRCEIRLHCQGLSMTFRSSSEKRGHLT